MQSRWRVWLRKAHERDRHLNRTQMTGEHLPGDVPMPKSFRTSFGSLPPTESHNIMTTQSSCTPAPHLGRCQVVVLLVHDGLLDKIGSSLGSYGSSHSTTRGCAPGKGQFLLQDLCPIPEGTNWSNWASFKHSLNFHPFWNHDPNWLLYDSYF